MLNWPPLPPKNFFPWTSCGRKTSGIPSTPISWPSAATRSGSWPRRWKDCEYYLRGVEDVLACIHDTGVAVELNTKYLKDTGRLFPNVRWLPMVMETGATLVVNSDAHYPDKLDNGRPEALKLIE